MLCQLSTDKADEEKRGAERGGMNGREEKICGSEGGLQSVRLQGPGKSTQNKDRGDMSEKVGLNTKACYIGEHYPQSIEWLV